MPKSSLFDPTADQVTIGLTTWFETALFGLITTALSAIAVAFFGLGMLSGRLNLGYGARVLLGVIVLLGAPAIAASFVTSSERETVALRTSGSAKNAPVRELPAPNQDPYAGASLRRD